MKRNRVTKEKLEMTLINRVSVYGVLTSKRSTHGKCTSWIRENRRRRSVGLPQKRILPNGAEFDPMLNHMVITMSDGTKEIIQL